MFLRHQLFQLSLALFLVVLEAQAINEESKRLSQETPEEGRLPDLMANVPEIAVKLRALEATLDGALPDNTSLSERKDKVAQLGKSLWLNARASVQKRGSLDDRPLYWQRLLVSRHLRNQSRRLALIDSELKTSLDLFEKHSRGQTDLVWHDKKAHRVLITGFDPFFLDRSINQSNPSGLIALALDGKTLEVRGESIEINAVLFPVRYQDFDAGMVEAFLNPVFSGNELSLFVSISMGRDDFDLERFPGRRRSSAALGNLREHPGGSLETPVPPFLNGEPLDGPEFLEFSLPVASMQRASGDFKVHDNREVVTLERGTFIAKSLTDLQGQTAVLGSGGGYLSNEISYRSLRLAQHLGATQPMGHLHVPRIQGHDPAALAKILKQTQAMLVEAVLGVE
jgi:pyrrolidone-carboxylate peptidase